MGERRIEMEMDEKLHELKLYTHRLKSLLDNPHPGLITWCMAVGRAVELIVKWWEREESK
jgi:hypothetical protein